MDHVCFGQDGFKNLGSIEPKSNMLMMFLMINVIGMNVGSYACMISWNLNEPMHVSTTLVGWEFRLSYDSICTSFAMIWIRRS